MRIAGPVFLCTSLLVVPLWAGETANPMQPGGSWPGLRHDVFGAAEIGETPAALALDAPFRAHDPALVPVHVTQPEGAPRLSQVTLVIDENPAPVAATITLGQAMHPLDLELRVRVNAYSNLRAVGRTAGGDWVMAGRFVRASGGCAAPAGKDAEAALAHLGEMRFQAIASEATPEGLVRTAKLMLRHPNYSGLQRDPVTQLSIPARYVDRLEVRQGDELLFAISGGISISEDPVFTFRYLDRGAGMIRVHAVDTEGTAFEGSFAQTSG